MPQPVAVRVAEVLLEIRLELVHLDKEILEDLDFIRLAIQRKLVEEAVVPVVLVEMHRQALVGLVEMERLHQ